MFPVHFCSPVGLHPLTFLKISPGCQPRSPDICEKPRRRFGVAVIGPRGLKRLPKKGRQEVAFFFSAFLVVCCVTIKETHITNCDLTSRRHSSRLMAFQPVKT